MQEGADQNKGRARAGLGLLTSATLRNWLWPFAAGLAVGLLLLPLAAFLWQGRDASAPAGNSPAAIPAEPPPQAALTSEPAVASFTIFVWRDDRGMLRRAAVDTARYDEFVAAEQRQ